MIGRKAGWERHTLQRCKREKGKERQESDDPADKGGLQTDVRALPAAPTTLEEAARRWLKNVPNIAPISMQQWVLFFREARHDAAPFVVTAAKPGGGATYSVLIYLHVSSRHCRPPAL